MRFFTMEWWCGIQSGEMTDPSPRYAQHLSRIREQLPTELLATEDSVSLHDGLLREAKLDVVRQELVLAIETYGNNERLQLVYRGVQQFDSVSDPETGLGGSYGYGDLGYSELDVLPTGLFEHRLLFSTGIELVIAFRDFRLERLP